MANDKKDQPKKVRIHVSRKITLERFEKDPVVLHAGTNLVDPDVAEHPFVKSHTVDAPSDAAADAELQAKIAEQLETIAGLEAKVAELQAMVDAFTATDASKKK